MKTLKEILDNNIHAEIKILEEAIKNKDTEVVKKYTGTEGSSGFVNYHKILTALKSLRAIMASLNIKKEDLYNIINNYNTETVDAFYKRELSKNYVNILNHKKVIDKDARDIYDIFLQMLFSWITEDSAEKYIKDYFDNNYKEGYSFVRLVKTNTADSDRGLKKNNSVDSSTDLQAIIKNNLGNEELVYIEVVRDNFGYVSKNRILEMRVNKYYHLKNNHKRRNQFILCFLFANNVFFNNYGNSTGYAGSNQYCFVKIDELFCSLSYSNMNKTWNRETYIYPVKSTDFYKIK